MPAFCIRSEKLERDDDFAIVITVTQIPCGVGYKHESVAELRALVNAKRNVLCRSVALLRLIATMPPAHWKKIAARLVRTDHCDDPIDMQE